MRASGISSQSWSLFFIASITLMPIPKHFDLRRMKCLLFALIRKFEFDFVLPMDDIVWPNQTMIRRPVVRGAEHDGHKFPLYVKVHAPDV